MKKQSALLKMAARSTLVFRVKCFCEGLSESELKTVIEAVTSLLPEKKPRRASQTKKD